MNTTVVTEKEIHITLLDGSYKNDSLCRVGGIVTSKGMNVDALTTGFNRYTLSFLEN